MRPTRKLGAGVHRGGASRYPSAPSFVRACELAADVYRHAASPALVGPEFTYLLQTRRRCVPAPIASVLTWPEFTPPLKTRGRSVPAAGVARTREGRVYAGPESSARVCTRGLGRAARTRADITESCKLGPGVLRPGGRRDGNPAVCDAVMVKRAMARAAYLRSCVIEPSAGVSHQGDSRISRSTPATSWHGAPLSATHRGRACRFPQTGAGCVRRRVRTRHDLAGSCELGPGVYPRPSRPRTHRDRACKIVRTVANVCRQPARSSFPLPS